MAKIFEGAIVNGYKILKLIFRSIIPNRSIYKVRCESCGTTFKKRIIDIINDKCKCLKSEEKIEDVPIAEEPKKEKKARVVYFSKKDPKKNIGIERGKYVVVGYLTKKEVRMDGYMFTPYIVKCALCGKLLIMDNRNLNQGKAKRDRGTHCNHKRFFDKADFKAKDYYLDEELLKKL